MKKFLTSTRGRIGILLASILIVLIAWYIINHPNSPCIASANTTPFLPVFFNPDQETILQRTDLVAITPSNANHLNEIGSLKLENPGITDVAFNPSGDLLAIANKDIIRLIDVSTGQEVSALSNNQAHIRRIAFSRDGMKIALASTENGVHIWDVVSRTEEYVLENLDEPVYDTTFTPSGDQLVTASVGKSSLRFWNSVSYQEMSNLSRDSVAVNSVAIHPNGTCLVVAEMPRGASGSNAIRLLNFDATIEQTLPPIYEGNISKVIFSPDGQTIVSAGLDNTVRLWRVDTGEAYAVFQQTSDVLDLSFSSDGLLLATGSGDLGGKADNSIQIWDISTETQLVNFRLDSDIIRAVAFSPGGKILVSASQSGMVRFWGIESSAN